MYIVKNLKDYNLSHKQRIFAGYLKDNIDSFVCYEKVTNRSAMRKYFAPDNMPELFCKQHEEFWGDIKKAKVDL